MLIQSLGGKLNNDYSNSNAVKKGIIFDKNKDGSYFTLRPHLPTNLLQITKNDSIGLMSLDSSGNVSFEGSVTAKDYVTDTGVSLKGLNTKTNKLYNIGSGSTLGQIYRYGDNTHTVGITWKEYSTSYNPVPRFVFDGRQTFDVIPNNPGTDNYKIVNCYVSVTSSGIFRLNFVFYIDGTYYSRYINLS